MTTDTVIKINKNAMEQDITIIMPDNSEITLQYRCYDDEATLDICFENHMNVINWEDDDMTPAKASKEIPELMKNVKQLCITNK
jgi:acyl-CoA thioesterase FadM